MTYNLKAKDLNIQETEQSSHVSQSFTLCKAIVSYLEMAQTIAK